MLHLTNCRASFESSEPTGKNPFSSFGSLTAPKIATSNPFASLTGLSAPSTSVKKLDQTSSIIKQAPANFGSVSATPKKESEPTVVPSFVAPPATPLPPTMTSIAPLSKIEKLNNAFAKWLDRQSVDHPVSIWSGGLKVLISSDYTAH